MDACIYWESLVPHRYASISPRKLIVLLSSVPFFGTIGAAASRRACSVAYVCVLGDKTDKRRLFGDCGKKYLTVTASGLDWYALRRGYMSHSVRVS